MSCCANERRNQPFPVRCSPACHGGTPRAASWPLSPLPAHFPYCAGPVAPQQRGNLSRGSVRPVICVASAESNSGERCQNPTANVPPDFRPVKSFCKREKAPQRNALRCLLVPTLSGRSPTDATATVASDGNIWTWLGLIKRTGQIAGQGRVAVCRKAAGHLMEHFGRQVAASGCVILAARAEAVSLGSGHQPVTARRTITPAY